jgi:hypothetical protein
LLDCFFLQIPDRPHRWSARGYNVCFPMCANHRLKNGTQQHSQHFFFAAAAGHTVICNVAANPQLLERLEIIFSRSRVTIDVNMFFFVLQPTAEWLRCISLSRNHDSDPSALRSSNRTSVALITWLRMREHNIRDGG